MLFGKLSLILLNLMTSSCFQNAIPFSKAKDLSLLRTYMWSIMTIRA